MIDLTEFKQKVLHNITSIDSKLGLSLIKEVETAQADLRLAVDTLILIAENDLDQNKCSSLSKKALSQIKSIDYDVRI